MRKMRVRQKKRGVFAMKCPYCGYQESKVVDSRHSEDGQSIRRRRECLSCQKRFTTYETCLLYTSDAADEL